jgi:predicted nucleic acid-binding protein
MKETFVLDCSVAAKWVLPEPGSEPALRLFDRYVSGEISLIAPDLLLAEFASLLAKQTRRKLITIEQARKAYHLMTQCAPPLFDTSPRLFGALHLALQHHMSLWDCVYLALALEHNCSLVTADRRLFRAGAARHPFLQLVQ